MENSSNEWSNRQLKIMRDHADTMPIDKISFLVGKAPNLVRKKMEQMGLIEREEPKQKKIKRPPAVYSNKSFWNGNYDI